MPGPTGRRVYIRPEPGESNQDVAERILAALDDPGTMAGIQNLIDHVAFAVRTLQAVSSLDALRLSPSAEETAAFAIAWRVATVGNGGVLDRQVFWYDFNRRFHTPPNDFEVELATEALQPQEEAHGTP